MKSTNDIEEISALTELLALNALMESAKMGEDGSHLANVATSLKDLSTEALKLLKQHADEDIHKNGEAIEHGLKEQLQAMCGVFDSFNNLNLTQMGPETRLDHEVNNDLAHLGQTLKAGPKKFN